MGILATDTQVIMSKSSTVFQPDPYVYSDYSQWERKKVGSQSYDKVLSHLSSLSLGTTARGDDGVIVARHELASSGTRGGRPSYTHRQLSDRRSLKPTPSAQIRILKTQVDIKKETLKNYKEHLMKLQNHNHLLMSTIQSQENHTHNSVSRSLDKYHKFKGVLSIIKQRGTSDIRERRCELQELTRITQQEIQKLNDELNKKQKEINKNTNQMQKLLNYKEKEYPMKLVQIDQLKLQVDYLDDLHQKEEMELEDMLQEERDKFEKKMEETRLRLEAHASEHWLSQMKRSVFARAVHNKIMAKEIELQDKTSASLGHQIDTLKQNIDRLRSDLKQNSALQSPLSKLGKCSPHSEITLDIKFCQEMSI